jgi:hypothetical protein
MGIRPGSPPPPTQFIELTRHRLNKHCSLLLLHYTRPHYATLRYITLHYTILHYRALRYATLYCVLLHHVTLHTTLYYITLHYATLYCTTLHYTTLRYNTLRYTILRYATLRMLRHTTLCYTTPRYATHYTTLHYTILLYCIIQSNLHPYEKLKCHVRRQLWTSYSPPWELEISHSNVTFQLAEGVNSASVEKQTSSGTEWSLSPTLAVFTHNVKTECTCAKSGPRLQGGPRL